MAERYFRKFPVINYDGWSAVNLTVSGSLLTSVSRNPFVFYPYEIAYGERPDQLADRYYNDPTLSWLVYYSAGVYDPYFQWYVPDDSFSEVINDRYGSIAEATRLVRGYRCNWYEDESTITVGRFESLDVEQTKYWEPVYGAQNRVVAYKRARKDWRRHTNRIVSYAVDGSSLARDETVTITIAPGYTGTGQVARSTSSYVALQHVSGYYVDSVEVPLSSASLTGSDGSALPFTESPTVLADVIPPEEQVYWSPYTAHDLEVEANAARKNVRVMDKRLALQASMDLSRAVGDPNAV